MPIFVLSVIALLQGIITKTVGEVAGGYISMLFLIVGLLLVGILGGKLGEEIKTKKLNKHKAQLYLATFLNVSFFIVIILFQLIFVNIFITVLIIMVVMWFVSGLIITFPPIYKNLKD